MRKGITGNESFGYFSFIEYYMAQVRHAKACPTYLRQRGQLNHF
jgi:hypothetical protein